MNCIGRNKLKMSIESACLDAQSITKLIGEPVYDGLVAGHGKRGLVLIHRGSIDYWCDYITGQLYGHDFNCLSSDRLKLLSAPTRTNRKVPKPGKLNSIVREAA